MSLGEYVLLVRLKDRMRFDKLSCLSQLKHDAQLKVYMSNVISNIKPLK